MRVGRVPTITNTRKRFHSTVESLALALTLLTLGTGVGCLGDDLRNPNLDGPPCLPIVAGVAFWLASHTLLLFRKATAKLADLVALTGGGAAGIVAVDTVAWPAPEWMLAASAAAGGVLWLLGVTWNGRRTPWRTYPRVIRTIGRAGAFLLLSLVSELGGGFLILFTAEHGRPETARFAGQEGAAVGSALTILLAAVLWATVWRRSTSLRQLGQAGVPTLVVGCAAAWEIGPAAAPAVVMVAVFFGVLSAEAREPGSEPGSSTSREG